MELSAFDTDFAPKEGAVQPGKFASDNAKLLKDGTYTVKVSGGVLKSVNNNPVVTLTFVVLSDGPFAGLPIEKTYFFVKKGGEHDTRKIQELAKDLGTMGVETAGFVMSQHLAGALKVIRGCELEVAKKAGGDEGQYANLYVNKRSATDGRPEKFPIATLTDAGGEQTTSDGDVIPF